jgi:hypothetical protein
MPAGNARGSKVFSEQLEERREKSAKDRAENIN